MTTQELLNKAASNLAGRAVKVRIQEPIWSTKGGAAMSGAAYRSRDNQAIVDLNPGAAVFANFLHEVGHIKADWRSMTPTDIWKAAPRSQVIPDARRAELKASPMESRADRFASIWAGYCSRYAWYYSRPTPLESKLAALAEWPRLDIESALKLWQEGKELEAAQRAAAKMRA